MNAAGEQAPASPYRIRPAADAADYQAARGLFRDYAAGLQVDLCFQGFERELERLPEMYGPPRGGLLLAFRGGLESPVGCVAVRPLDGQACEMKRLYVQPQERGHGLGRRLAIAILQHAAQLGYRCMRLDTLAQMTAAIALYESLDFRRIAPYYPNPLETPVFLERALP